MSKGSRRLRKLSVIIPVFNEERTIAEIIQRVLAQSKPGSELEIVVVDDGSDDGTEGALAPFRDRIRYIKHSTNRGKGAAIKTGLTQAQGEFVIFQDADLEYDPADYPALLGPLEGGQVEMVIGSRVLSGSMWLFGQGRTHWMSYVGCKLIAGLINVLYRRKGTDYYACYKVVRRDVLNRVSVEANGFEYDSELLCKLLKHGTKMVEVPIHYYPRSYREGKKLRYWRAGLAVLLSIIKWRFQP